jgi:hypothetical protein
MDITLLLIIQVKFYKERSTSIARVAGRRGEVAIKGKGRVPARLLKGRRPMALPPSGFRSCAFETRLEPVLRGDPVNILFQQHRAKADTTNE